MESKGSTFGLLQLFETKETLYDDESEIEDLCLEPLFEEVIDLQEVLIDESFNNSTDSEVDSLEFRDSFIGCVTLPQPDDDLNDFVLDECDSYTILTVFISSGTDEVRAKREPSPFKTESGQCTEVSLLDPFLPFFACLHCNEDKIWAMHYFTAFLPFFACLHCKEDKIWSMR